MDFLEQLNELNEMLPLFNFCIKVFARNKRKCVLAEASTNENNLMIFLKADNFYSITSFCYNLSNLPYHR